MAEKPEPLEDFIRDRYQAPADDTLNREEVWWKGGTPAGEDDAE